MSGEKQQEKKESVASTGGSLKCLWVAKVKLLMVRPQTHEKPVKVANALARQKLATNFPLRKSK